jgi:hypothetical protein
MPPAGRDDALLRRVFSQNLSGALPMVVRRVLRAGLALGENAALTAADRPSRPAGSRMRQRARVDECQQRIRVPGRLVRAPAERPAAAKRLDVGVG